MISYQGPGKTDSDACSVRSNKEISPSCGIYYYETTIVSKGKDGYIAVGFSTSPDLSNKLPGDDDTSWGYHAATGKKMNGHGTGKTYGPVYSTGDVIGCCVNFSEGSIAFTRNGIMLGIVI
jgi:hypothetical protein